LVVFKEDGFFFMVIEDYLLIYNLFLFLC
jgi:hypothetical protein